MEHMTGVYPLHRNPEWFLNFSKNIKMLTQFIFYWFIRITYRFSCIDGTDHQCIQMDKHKLAYDCLCDKPNQFRMYLDMDLRIDY